MANGMTFNGVASSTLSLEHCVPRISILPERIGSAITIQGRDGSFDFNNDSYAPRIVPVDCLLKASTEAELTNRIAAISVWLSGSGYLVFDSDTTKRWYAKVYSDGGRNFIPLATLFTVNFEAQPYAEDVTETTGAIGSAINYGSAIEFYPTIEITMTSAATSVRVTLTSTAEYVLVTDSIENADVISFNMATGLVTNNSVSCMDKVSIASLFFGVPTGTQTISVTTDGTYTAAIKYRKRYLYA